MMRGPADDIEKWNLSQKTANILSGCISALPAKGKASNRQNTSGNVME